MVLGVQWLETLGEIKWDFKQLRMEFLVQGQRHIPKGNPPTTKLKTINGKELSKLLPHIAECFIIRLYSLQLKDQGEVESHCYSNGVGMTSEDQIHEQVLVLLNQYESLLKEPTQLPSYRNHDHKIPLN